MPRRTRRRGPTGSGTMVEKNYNGTRADAGAGPPSASIETDSNTSPASIDLPEMMRLICTAACMDEANRLIFVTEKGAKELGLEQSFWALSALLIKRKGESGGPYTIGQEIRDRLALGEQPAGNPTEPEDNWRPDL